MNIAVLGSTGATGGHLVEQALARGHRVVALARDPTRLKDIDAPAFTVVRADVHDPASVHAAVTGVDVLVSGVGTGPADAPGTLLAGARAAQASGVPRLVWLGALGTGESRPVAGPIAGPLLQLILRRELADKVAADRLLVAAGFTVVHAGRLTDGPLGGRFRLVPVDDARRHWFPPSVSRADVAALMLDEAEAGHHPGQTLAALRT